MALSKVKTSGMACSALDSSAHTATPPCSPTKRPTVIATRTTLVRLILASFHHTCLSVRIRLVAAHILLDTTATKLVELASAHALSVHSRGPLVVVSNHPRSNKAMPLRWKAWPCQTVIGRDCYGPMVTFSRILSTITLAIPAFVTSSSIVL